MEELKKHIEKPKLLDWRAHVDVEKISNEDQEKFSMLAELAFSEGVDFEKQAKKFESSVAGDGEHRKANLADLLIMWAYTKKLIIAEEYRSLQGSVSK